MKYLRFIIAAAAIGAFVSLSAAAGKEQASDPTATHYSTTECLGSARPYPVPEGLAEVPDSLTPIFLNHVGRHGARYLSSAAPSVKLAEKLAKPIRPTCSQPRGARCSLWCAA